VLTDATRVLVGQQQVLLNDGDLGLRSIPAAGIAVFENRPGHVRLLLGSGKNTYLIGGVDLKHLNTLPRVVFGPGEPGTFDNGSALYIKCSKPKEWEAIPQQGGRGIGWAGGLADASGKHFYIFYTDLSTSPPVGQINVARCSLDNGPPLPGNWKKYYNGAFAEAGIGGKETPVIDVYSDGQSGAWYGRPTYSRSMGKYIMVFAVNRVHEWEESLPPQTSGIYLAVSDDLVKWSGQFKLISGYTKRVLGKPIVLAPTIVFDQDDKASAWLAYGFSPKYSTEALSNVGTPFCLVGRRITFKSMQP
jgi:hypothetical protein